MEKSRFVEISPAYYALAICVYLQEHVPRLATRIEIEDEFFSPGTEDNPEYSYLEKPIVFEKATRWLIERGVIELLTDDFGPPVYKPTRVFDEQLSQLSENISLPFYKFRALQNDRRWLNSALLELNRIYGELDITDIDFENPDEEWHPLPLDQNNLQLQTAIKALDEMVELVRADNGYNATVPEERNYVIEALASVSRTLKKATSTSLPYLEKFAFEPLATLIRRFKNAAIGIAAVATRDALVELLKQYGIKLIGSLFS